MCRAKLESSFEVAQAFIAVSKPTLSRPTVAYSLEHLAYII